MNAATVTDMATRMMITVMVILMIMDMGIHMITATRTITVIRTAVVVSGPIK
jgi:hypothetical protein